MIAGCATGTTEDLDRRIATYVGRPEAEVVTGLGVPNRTYEGDGRHLLQHEFLRPCSAPAILPGVGLGLRLEEWELVPAWASAFVFLLLPNRSGERAMIVDRSHNTTLADARALLVVDQPKLNPAFERA
jgi:hypothetical protein